MAWSMISEPVKPYPVNRNKSSKRITAYKKVFYKDKLNDHLPKIWKKYLSLTLLFRNCTSSKQHMIYNSRKIMSFKFRFRCNEVSKPNLSYINNNWCQDRVFHFISCITKSLTPHTAFLFWLS